MSGPEKKEGEVSLSKSSSSASSGFRAIEDLAALSTEARRGGPGLDTLDALGMVEAMHQADSEALAAVRAVLPAVATAIEQTAARMVKGGRLIYCGAGTSGRLGVLDASECVPTFGVPSGLVIGLIAGGERALREAVEGAEDDPSAGAAAIEAVGASRLDTVVGIAASGRTPWVLGAMRQAREADALTIGLSCVSGSAVEQAGHAAITVATGPEVVTGSTRLKAGTATKLVLNMLSTGVMARLGYIYGELMVNVQPTNAKLRDRATRITAELCGATTQEAAALLEEADDEVKTAVVMRKRGVGATEARALLQAGNGILRQALNMFEGRS